MITDQGSHRRHIKPSLFAEYRSRFYVFTILRIYCLYKVQVLASS